MTRPTFSRNRAADAPRILRLLNLNGAGYLTCIHRFQTATHVYKNFIQKFFLIAFFEYIFF